MTSNRKTQAHYSPSSSLPLPLPLSDSDSLSDPLDSLFTLLRFRFFFLFSSSSELSSSSSLDAFRRRFFPRTFSFFFFFFGVSSSSSSLSSSPASFELASQSAAPNAGSCESHTSQLFVIPRRVIKYETFSMSPSTTSTFSSISICSTDSCVSVILDLDRNAWICKAVGYCGAADMG